MEVAKLHHDFLRYCSLEENLSPKTIKGMKSGFRTFLLRTGIKNLNEVTIEVVRNFFYEGKEKYLWSVSSTLNHIKHLKKFFNWCIIKGYLHKSPILDIKKPKQPKNLPRVLTKEEANNILCSSFSYTWHYTFEQYRNYAIIATLLYTGIRAEELLSLRVIDINLSSERIFISLGKGRKDRYVPIYRRLKQVLDSYVRERKRLNKTSEYFFTGAQSNSRLNYKDLTRICAKISKHTGIKFTAHVLRHTAATEMLNAGMDIYKVSRILGHTDIKTTTIYLHTATKDLQKSLNEVELY